MDATQYLSLNWAQIDALFSASPAGAVPSGRAVGTALMLPGSSLNHLAARMVNFVAWQGKTFDPRRGRLTNCVTPLRVDAVPAGVYEGVSWFDGKACIVLDYSKTSLVARFIRDEIREVSPGMYLGIAFWARRRIIAFLLEFNERF